MPTIFTHTFLGALSARVAGGTGMPVRFWVLSLLLPTIPDFDVISFQFDIPYSHVLGHRGITHSLLFAAAIGGAASWYCLRRTTVRMSGLTLFLYFFLLTASHGLLDGLTNGGLGVAYFAPFENSRYFLPWRPVQVSPIGIDGFLSLRGLRTIQSELLWLWLPAGFLAAVGIYARSAARNRR